MTDLIYDRNSEPLAIVGLSCLFPGAENIKKYWDLIKSGADTFTAVPKDHWDLSDYYSPDPKAKDKTYGQVGAFLAPVDFAPMKYGIAPKDLPAIDTTQLLALMVADAALKDAGYPYDGGYDHQRTAVLFGITGALKSVVSLGSRLAHPQIRKAMKAVGLEDGIINKVLDNFSEEFPQWQENSFPGLLGNVTAGRVANRLNLGGANMVLDAACGSSLAAIYQAVWELRSGRADMVVTGGVDTFSDPFMYTCFSKTPALSPRGQLNAYDKKGDGTILGEGVGLVVLKRLSDATRAGDRIYAVIKGVGAASDGKGSAIFAPSVEGQKRAVTAAYDEAGFDPLSVELLEGHGTGTAVGDNVEVEALRAVFSQNNNNGSKGPWCALGSVKSQIGHTKAAAGIAGLIKAALSLYHKVLPPTANVSEPLEALLEENSPIYLNNEVRPWISSSEQKRRAGVSAFGFGGSNFHCLLEEADRQKAFCENTDLLWGGSGNTIEDILQKLQSFICFAQDDAKSIAHLARQSLLNFNGQDEYRLLLLGAEESLLPLALQVSAGLTEKIVGFKSTAGVYFGQGHEKKSLVLVPPSTFKVNMLKELALAHPLFLKALDDFSKTSAAKWPLSPALSFLLYPPSLAATEWQNVWRLGTENRQLINGILQAVAQGLNDVLCSCGLTLNKIIDSWNFSSIDFLQNNDQSLETLYLNFASEWDAVLKPKGNILFYQNNLTKFLASLASFGFAVDFKDLIEGPSENKQETDTFTIPLTGANYFIKKEYPHQSAEPLSAVFNGQNNVALSGSLTETLGKMAAEASRLHQDYLQQHAELINLMKGSFVQGEYNILQQQPTATNTGLAGEQTELAAPSFETKSEPKTIFSYDAFSELMKIVSEETGYPEEMLKREMDLESDLGLDSIKRVEIMAAISERWPEINTEGLDLNQARTLGELAALIGLEDGVVQAQNISPKEAVNFIPRAVAEDNGFASDDLWSTLKKVVAAETGYPEAMLTLEMDMEADLGLDSIKRVEIMAALGEALPHLEDLSSLYGRTMGELLNGLKKLAPANPVPFSPEILPVSAAPALLDDNNYQRIVLEVVAEETGYPQDMLKLDMQLEEDLGLDSIKRVEILAALNAKIPGLESSANAAEFSTLNDLVFWSSNNSEPRQVASADVFSSPAASEPGNNLTIDIKSLLVKVISQETGFPLDMLSLDSRLDEDLGLDSIKKVEIMAALHEALGEDINLSGVDVNQAGTIAELCQLLAVAVPVGADFTGAEFTGSEFESEAAPAPKKMEQENRPAVTQVKRRVKNQPLSVWHLKTDALALDSLRQIPELLAPESKAWIVGRGALAANLVSLLEQQGVRCFNFSWDDDDLIAKAPWPDSLIIIWPGAEDDPALALKAFSIMQKAGSHFELGIEKGRRGLLLGITFMGGAFALASSATRKSTPINPLSASLAGLIKSAVREWPNFVGRIIDLPLSAYGLESHDYVVGLVKAARVEAPLEIASPRPGIFYHLTTARHEVGGNQRPINPGEVVVVTGGGRGVTAQVALELAHELKPHLVILGRSLLGEEEPQWLANLENEAEIKRVLFEKAQGAIKPNELGRECRKILYERELRNNLKTFEAAGARVTYISGDMRDQAIFKKTLSDISREYGPIRGFIHGAGVLQDSLISRKKNAEFNLVFDTKVKIALAALAQLKHEPLALLVFFSSSSARFGRRGQSDYAAGNEVLNKLAHVAQRRWPRAKVVSVNWGPWAGGMVDPSLAKTFAKEGIGLIPLVEGAQLLARLITEPSGQSQEIMVFGPGTDLTALGLI